MGGMGGKNDEPSASKQAGEIAEDMYKRVRPLQRTFVRQGENFMQGGFDPTGMPMWDVGKRTIDDQYDRAREGMISNMPTGGALQSSLAGTEIDRANAMGNLSGGIAQDEYNKIYGMATGTPQQSMNTLTNVGASQAAMQGQQSAGKFGALGDLGMGAGMYMGGKEQT